MADRASAGGGSGWLNDGADGALAPTNGAATNPSANAGQPSTPASPATPAVTGSTTTPPAPPGPDAGGPAHTQHGSPPAAPVQVAVAPIPPALADGPVVGSDVPPAGAAVPAVGAAVPAAATPVPATPSTSPVHRAPRKTDGTGRPTTRRDATGSAATGPATTRHGGTPATLEPAGPSANEPVATPPVATPPIAPGPQATAPAPVSTASPAGLTAAASTSNGPPATTPRPASQPIATGPISTQPVATTSVATPSLPTQTARSSRRNPMPPRTARGRAWWRGNGGGSSAGPSSSQLSLAHPAWPAPGRLSLGLATGSAADNPSADFQSTKPSPAAAPHRFERPPRAPTVRRSGAAPRPIPQLALRGPLPAQTLLPIGGASAASSGGFGSAAPPVMAALEGLSLALATILLAGFSLDLAPWRSTLLASRLERPG